MNAKPTETRLDVARARVVQAQAALDDALSKKEHRKRKRVRRPPRSRSRMFCRRSRGSAGVDKT